MNLPVKQGGTGAATPVAARTALGLDPILAGKADLDGAGKLVASQIPAIAITDYFKVGSQAAMLALVAQVGDIAQRTDTGAFYMLSTNSPGTLADWAQFVAPGTAIQEVAGLTTPVITTAALKTALGLAASFAAKADLVDGKLPLVQMPNLNLGSISLDDYAEFSSGGTNWSPALTAALNDADINQKYLRIANGDRSMTGKVIANTTNKIVIEGKGRSALNWQTADGGIDLTYNSVFQPPTIEGLFLRTAVAAGGCPLKITAPYSPSVTVLGLILDEIRCIGMNPAQHYWSTGLTLSEAWNPRIRGFNFKGLDQTTAPFSAPSGLVLNNCQAVIIRDPFIAHAEIGISETGDHWSEGFQCSGGELVGISTGIALKSTIARLGTSIHDMHINAYLFCIDISNQWGISVHDNLLFKTNFSTSGWSAVRLINGRHAKIHDNHLRPAGASGGANGFILRDSSFCKVHDNTGDDWGSQGGNMVTLFGASSYNEIFTNSRMGNSPPPVNYQDAGTGTGNRYFGNAPENPLPNVNA